MINDKQHQVNQKNQEFWNELCGTQLAQFLGITDHSITSLEKFDSAFFGFYPYLFKYIKLEDFVEKKILEVGLGYGTLGQKLAGSSKYYTGLDIADGPVKMMNHRLEMFKLPGEAIKGNMLECPFDDESQDIVVSIGCFHHTGNIQRCVDETYRVLKPGGKAIIMVYNKYSHRQFAQWPKETLKALFDEYLRPWRESNFLEEQRKAYDANGEGSAAPETTFCSIGQIKKMFHKFQTVNCTTENSDPFIFRGKIRISREKLLNSLGKWWGLDIYITAKK